MKSISIIVPVYNAEGKLKSCIDSILCQSYKDFELILVDDGSTDSSGDVCDEFAYVDSRVIVIHKENGGLCSARNSGLEIASGDYLAFCDNDDIYLPGLLEDNIKLVQEYDADVVRFLRRRIAVYEDGARVVQDGNMNKICGGNIITFMQGKDIISNYAMLKEENATNTIWNGLYKTKLIKDYGISFDTRMRFGGEDILFNLKVLEVAGSYAFNNRVYYQYNKAYSESTSTKFDYNRVEAMLIYAEEERDFIRRHNLHKDIWSNYQISYSIMTAGLLNHANCQWSKNEKKAALRKLLKESVLGKDIEGNAIKDICKVIWKYSKGRAVMGYLFEHQIYGILMLAVKIYESMPSHRTFGL